MKKSIVFASLLGLILIACNVNTALVMPKDVKYLQEVGNVPERLSLEQNWPDSTKEKFWFTPQGAEIMPYLWFTWLEQPDSEELFRSSEYMSMLGYLPMKTSKFNPSGLPVGFVMTRQKSVKGAMLGFTCAACHTNQLDYQGNKYLIDGAPTLGNFVKFFDNLMDALNETHRDDEKFMRFAKRVLGGTYSVQSAEKLRSDLLKQATASGQRQMVNDLPNSFPDDFTSYARLDAFTNIENAGTAFALKMLSNRNTPAAPVSYPFLWGTHQSDVVQWNCSAPNTPVVGPLVRNTGQVVGVFGGLEIKKAAWWQRLYGKKKRYSSTIDFHGLGALELYVKDLRSPRWEDTNFPAINRDLAAAGEPLFKEHCARCHKIVKPADEGLPYKAARTPLDSLGTDPMTAWAAEHHMAATGILEGTKAEILIGDRFRDSAQAIQIPVNGVVGLVLKNPVKALSAAAITGEKETETKSWRKHVAYHERIRDSIVEHRFDQHGLMELAVMDREHPEDYTPTNKNLDGLVYKGRPLNGIWATAPYLHNGSVPSLWALMMPPPERPRTFWVGSREFDPNEVGYVYDRGKTKFQVYRNGKIMEGNSNLGHNYGTHLPEADRRALVEFMKTL
ncbi:di-heme-cytochrome C peroxidase [Lewinella sp. W8]|uniref:di-heme-cytochrome C peroxidase n=1 Tax=Lewinella sp. W8 TaxID=2528208 RepID=UPI00106816C3|nr:di-heme-cytochrome C peroxidase [Lewinella sp. W8]MTB53559.1 hypothetical protein [Lewinella sp. W8]